MRHRESGLSHVMRSRIGTLARLTSVEPNCLWLILEPQLFCTDSNLPAYALEEKMRHDLGKTKLPQRKPSTFSFLLRPQNEWHELTTVACQSDKSNMTGPMST